MTEYRGGGLVTAGFKELFEAGQLAPPYAVSRWGVPTGIGHDAERDLLIWRSPPGEQPVAAWATPDKKMLRGFIGLADAPVGKIVTYARTWGVLGVCREHGLPGDHGWRAFMTGCAPATLETVYADGGIALPPAASKVFATRACEPLATWRAYARQARGAMHLAAALYAPGTAKVDPAAWADLHATGLPADPPADDGRLALTLSFAVSDWLAVAGVRPEFLVLGRDGEWFPRPGERQSPQGGARAELRIQVNGLFGALGLALASALAGNTKVARCDNPTCGSFYFPDRRPRARGLHCCPACQEAGVPAKLRKRAERDRKRAATESGAAGAANVQPTM